MFFPLLLSLLPLVGARVVDFEDAGARAEDSSDEACWHNGRLMNATLAGLQPGDEFVVPAKTFHLMGGILAESLNSVTIRIDGTLSFSTHVRVWPTKSERGDVLDCIHVNNSINLTLTSSEMGLLDGNGAKWWGIPGIGYLIRAENRPKLLHISNATNCLVERMTLKDSPYWTLLINGNGVEIRHVNIDARRTNYDGHDIIDLTAFNTDGIDVHGRNFWIHDCNIWNQDDSIAIKDDSQNMLIERINASGVGLTIGSIEGSVVRNITFRDCYMHHTWKGIYMKFRNDKSPGYIGDILYENIVMDAPEQVPIWIGPAQQSDSRFFWQARPCSIFWPEDPFSSCYSPASGTYENITLRNITIINPKESPGVIFGNGTNPMKNVVFDNVVVQNPGKRPWGDKYYVCEHVQGVALGTTWPVPPCFEDRTSRSGATLVV